jgi:DNA-binding response OmpR family regulator
MANVLVIDDEPLVRKAMRVTLERAGHTVVEAADGAAGIRECQRCQFAVVICDILMPGKEGIETIRELRAAHPALKILAVSGGGRLSNIGFLEIATELGASDSLSKPFDPGDLLAKVNALCGRGG